MSTKIKEVPNWEVQDITAAGPAADFTPDSKADLPADDLSDSSTDAAFSRIEEALRDVAYQLGESEHSSEHVAADASGQHKTPVHKATPDANESTQRNGDKGRAAFASNMAAHAPAPEIASATHEYTRSFHELAHRIDNLEKFADTESLRDEVRGLRQRFMEDSDQFDSTLNESTGKISALSGAVDNLATNLAVMQDRSTQLGTTLEHSLSKLSQSLKHSEAQLGDTAKRISDTVESRLSFTDHDIEKVSQRLERTEIEREEKETGIKQALTALVGKLSAEKERNNEALAEIHASLASSLMEMKQGLSISETRLWEVVEGRVAAGERGIEDFKQRLSQADQSRSERDRALTDALESLRDKINADKTRSEAALTEVRSTLTSSLVSCLAEMKQGLEASEKRIQERLESGVASDEGKAQKHTQNLKQAEPAVKNKDASLNQTVASMLDQLRADRKKSVDALAEVRALLASSVSEMQQSLEESEKRVEKRLESRFSTIDSKFENISQRLQKTEQSHDGNDGQFSEIIESMSHRLEQIERQRSAEEQPLTEAVGNIARRLDRMEQDRSGDEQPLNEAIGNISQRLEQIEQVGAGNGAAVDGALAELKEQLKAEKVHTEKALTEIRSSLADVKESSAGPALPQRESSYSDLGFESVSHTGDEKDRSVTEIIADLTDGQNGENALKDEVSSESDLPDTQFDSDAISGAPSSFGFPPIETADSAAPEIEDSFSDDPESDEQDDLVTRGDYLSGARLAAQAAAEATSASAAQQTPLQSLASRVIGPDVKSRFFQRNRLAAVGAAILLIVGAGSFLLMRGSAPSVNDAAGGVAAVTPVEQTEDNVAATPIGQPGFAAALPPPAMPESGAEQTNAPDGQIENATAALAAELDGQAVSQAAVIGPQADGQAEATPIERLVSEARAGSSPAALILGLNYLNGDGVDADDSEAFRWLRLAAEQGEPVAQSRLGSMFERGQGVAADTREAAFWYEQAARSGNVRAMHNLAIAHADGAGVEENLGEAARLFRAAADLGLADSQFNLAVLYSQGMGLPASLSEAYKWYLIAGAQGDTEAQMRAETLAAELPQNERDAAEAAVAAFTPLAPNEAANTPPSLALIQ